MPPADVAMLAVLMFAAAALYSSVGHAGASGYLAAMALYGLAPEVMKPTALVLNLAVASIGAVRFVRAGHLDRRLLVPLVTGSVPCAFIGGAIALPIGAYRRVLAAVLLIAAGNLIVRAFRMKIMSDSPRPERTRPGAAVLAVIGAAIGLLSGLTGVGGGIFLSPLILIAGWASPRRTAAVSVVFILVNSAAGLAGHLMSVRNVPAAIPYWLLAVMSGGAIGSWLGARKFGSALLCLLLAMVLIIAAAKMLTP
jgi:hypothetical protein